MSLQLEHFGEFFRAVHDLPPFPWQTRLLRQVMDQGWPEALALPTAAGKTAVLDVAVFALALQAARPPAERTACRRIALVVDRRIVVDEASERARRIAESLDSPSLPVLQQMAEALRSLGGDRPLVHATLRGGIYLEEMWARSPVQPVILCSTVDQVGSRLLHRGYGLSSRARPLHAGLLANDTLIVLDEAHCSEPFRQTLRWIERFRQVAERPLRTPFSVVTMTATPVPGQTVFSPDDEDWRDPVLRERWSARKPAVLQVAPGDKEDKFVDACRQAVEEVLAVSGQTDARPLFGNPVRSVLVVVNRVATARELAKSLRDQATAAAKKKKGRRAETRDSDGKARWDVLLLTGRTRALERDRLVRQWRDRIIAGRPDRDPPGAPPLVVVATQCVEVGADLDLDALVTEACPLDALRQRLGRIDRLGRRGESPVRIVCRKELASGDKVDPVYGESLKWAWDLLQSLARDGTLDLGTQALRDRLEEAGDLGPVLSPKGEAPLLFPAFLDLWVQTGPEPEVSPDPALFLHGTEGAVPDVQVIWRSDLPEDRPDCWADIVGLCPPSTPEAMPVPLHLVRAWLAGDPRVEDRGGDIPEVLEEERDAKEQGKFRKALRWFGPDESTLAADPLDIRPGDVLVVPASYGGCDQEGWDTAVTQQVGDLAEEAILAGCRPAVLRVTPALWSGGGREVLEEIWKPLGTLDASSEDGWPEDLRQQVREALDRSVEALKGLPEADRPQGLFGVLDHLRGLSSLDMLPHPSGRGIVVRARRRVHQVAAGEDDSSVLSEGPVSLAAHMEQVGRLAADYAESAGLEEGLRTDVMLAGRLHDVGKADRRFQAWMQGGDIIRAARAGLVAKSDRLVPGTPQSEAARELAGYPKGYRHEVLSTRMVQEAPEVLRRASDPDLLLHLIVAHHGHGRPFVPEVHDPRPLKVRYEWHGIPMEADSDTGWHRIDSGVAERFCRLIRRYGWWGLSYLESLVKLADYRASECPDATQQRMEA